jgi:nucleotide-binding universal stress UspA family protein
MNHRTVVVGIDGSDPGYAAVEWAAHEAHRREALLRIVHVLEWHPASAITTPGHTRAEALWAASHTLLAEARRRVHVAPDAGIRSDSLLGRPIERLLELARDAELIAVGHRGRGGFAGMRLGSVSERLARRARCPVAVICGPPTENGPVIVGVDGGAGTDAVLNTAFEAASGRSCRLVVVHSTAFDRSHADGSPETVVKPWTIKFPEVETEMRLTGDAPGPALIRSAAGAQLAVLGSRGSDRLRSALLGSTGLQLLHHATCPVLITRPGDAGFPDVVRGSAGR